MSSLGDEIYKALSLILRVHKQQIHTAIPGRIVSFDEELQRAEVEVAIQQWARVEGGPDGGFEKWPAPLLPSVPVLFPRGGGAFITWPIRKGDYCLVIFQERSIDQWCQKGGTQVDPIWRWEHDLSDAVCIPGFYPYPEALKDLDTETIALGFENGSARLRVKEDVVEVGGNADYVALAGKVDSALKQLKNAILNAVPGSQDGGAALQKSISGNLKDWPPDIAATKAKAE